MASTTGHEQSDREVDAAVTFAFNDESLRVVLKRPYKVWEAAFVRRWQLPPIQPATAPFEYMAKRGLDPAYLSIVEALQVYHTNSWRVEPWQLDLYNAMERDYDVVPPEIQDDRTREDLNRLDLENQRLNPIRKRGETIVDFGKNKLWKPGDK